MKWHSVLFILFKTLPIVFSNYFFEPVPGVVHSSDATARLTEISNFTINFTDEKSTPTQRVKVAAHKQYNAMNYANMRSESFELLWEFQILDTQIVTALKCITTCIREPPICGGVASNGKGIVDE